MILFRLPTKTHKMKKILRKIMEQAVKMKDEEKQKAFLLAELEKHYDEIPFSDIEQLMKETENDVSFLKKEIEKLKNKNKK